MDLNDLIEICAAFADLGGAVADQLAAIVRDGDLADLVARGDLNPNALRPIRAWLVTVARIAGHDDVADDLRALIADVDRYEAADRREAR
jgi:hypothetical protein